MQRIRATSMLDLKRFTRGYIKHCLKTPIYELGAYKASFFLLAQQAYPLA
ncbi:MAG: hypothetical protein AAGI49_15605 [Bacteroidota bacterium]